MCRIVAVPATPVGLSGKLALRHGAPIAGAPVEIQTVSGDGVETTLSTVDTDAGGHWSASLTVSRVTLVRALHRVFPAAVSDLLAIEVRPVLALSLASGSPPRVSGTIAPPRRYVTIDLYKLIDGHRHLLSSGRATVRRGAFAARLSLGARAHGQYVVVARAAADEETLAGASAPLELTI